jgi:alanyl-tRNA synthetase
VEFLNLLFICLRFDEHQRIIPLEDAFTEVVIGRERITALLNHAATVYDVNTIGPLVQHVAGFSKYMPQDEDLSVRYQRTIADHLRALLFLVQDGAPKPGKAGRARLMRILARELLTSQRLLGISDRGFLRSLTTLALELYPHLAHETQEKLLRMLMEEQASFETTLQKGLEALEKSLEKGTITPAEIVKMEKVRGIPFDLLSHRFWQKRMAIDMPAYQAELNAYLQAAKDGSD